MILFFEDERYYIEDIIDALEEIGYNAEVYGNAKKFLRCTDDAFEDIQLFILDMMVFGEGNELLSGKSNGGYESGLAILERIEAIELKRGSKRKKIVFTNRTGEFLNRLQNDKRIYKAISKSLYLPSEFVKIIDAAIKS